MNITKQSVDRIVIIVSKSEKSLAFDYCMTHGYDITSFYPELNESGNSYKLVAEMITGEE